MRKIILLIAFCSLTASVSAQENINHGDLDWYTNAVKAYEASKTSHKPIFALFTGSDWCVWCHKLERDVFQKKAFVEWAKKNVVLLELDFPRQKQLPQEQLQQNMGLQQTFGVQGYPTVWIFNMAKDTANRFNITGLGTLGYPAGAEPGLEEKTFIKNANKILKNK